MYYSIWKSLDMSNENEMGHDNICVKKIHKITIIQILRKDDHESDTGALTTFIGI